MTPLARALVLAVLPLAFDLSAQPLLTFAGGGTDDGKPATEISFQSLRHVAVDAAGNLFVVDADASLVRRIDGQTGLVSTVAGNGRQGFGGDGGTATRATLRAPTGIAIDAVGDLYLSDSENGRVRRVDAATGLIRTVAGGGNPADFVGDSGPATAAALGRPDGLALDGRGGLFIADPGGDRVRRVDLVSGLISTVAGSGGPSGFSGDGGPATGATLDRPSAVAVDAAGTLYIADANNNRIRRVNAATGLIDTVAGSGSGDFAGDGGPATQAGLAYPLAVALDASGRNLHILDTFHARVRKVALDGGTISTVAGGGSGGDGDPATAAQIGYYPRGLFVDAGGNLFVCDSSVRKVTTATGIISTIGGGGSYVGDGLPATQAILRAPQGLAVDPKRGSLLVADTNALRVREVAGGAKTISTRVGDGTYRLPYPVDVAVDAAGNAYVALYNGDTILRQDASGGPFAVYAGGGSPASGVGDSGPATGAYLNGPWGIGVDGAGNLFIADSNGMRIRRVDAATRVITTVAGTGKGAGAYQGGDFTGDGGPATLADLNTPYDVAVDASGDVFFTDYVNHRIRRVDGGTGIITTVAGSGPFGYAQGDFGGDGGPATQARLNYPTRLAFDRSGNLYVADTGNGRIRKLDAATNVITTFAGNGQRDYSGDGGLATASALDTPQGVAVDAEGNVYLSEAGNNLVRVVPTSGCPLPLVSAQPRSQTIVSGFAVVLSVGVSSASAVTYQWYRGIAGDTSNPVAAATGATFTTPPLTATTSYWVRVGNACGSVDSDTATITVSSLLADLTLTLDASPEPVPVGGRFTTTFTVRNNGPTAATGVTLTDTLPAAVTLVSTSASQGGCTGRSGTVTCAFGTLLQGAEARGTVVVTPLEIGAITTRARVSGDEPDPDESNNSTQRLSTVSPATSADLSIGQSASPFPARAGGLVTYSLFVANNGPAGATDIVVTDTLPENATLVVAAALLGTCTGSAPVTCRIGSLAAGVATTVTVIAQMPPTGPVRNAVSVAAAQDDPNPGNNAATLDVPVLPSTAACPAPAPTVLAWPSGVVRAGDTFTVAWSDVFGPTDPDGTYRAQLASAPDFGPSSLLSDTTTRNLSLSYPTAASAAASTLTFRVTAVAGCGTPGPSSPPVSISVAPNPPALVVTEAQSPEWTVAPGVLPPPATIRLRNIGGSATPVSFRTTGSFFTISPTSAVVAPGDGVTVTLTPTAGSTATQGSQSGSVTADWTVASLTQTVFLTVTGTTSQGSRPRVDQDEVLLVRSAAAAAPAALAAESSSVTVTNSGSDPIFLVPSVSPGGAWLTLDPAQFAEPLGPGQSRVISIGSDPSKVSPVDYPLPVFTVLTISAAGGLATDQVQVKVFYTEASTVVSGAGRGFLAPGESSFIVPTAVHKGGVGGTVFTSDGWLRNLSPDPVTFDVFATPSGLDGQVDAQKVTQTMPGFATVRLFDFIQSLFGTTDLYGPVEIRSKNAAQLSVRTTASGLPGTGDASSRYGTEIAVYGGGTGTGVGLPPLIMTGIKDTPDWRLNLIVAETTGTQAVVNLRLFDSGGVELASTPVTVPALGNIQFRLIQQLGIPEASVEAASLVIEPVSGTGRVVAIGTLIDNASQSFQGLTGQMLAATPASGARPGPLAATEIPPRVIPSIVHAAGIGAFFTTEISITNGTASPAVLHLVYDYTGSINGTATADVTLPPRGSLPAGQSRDAVLNLLGLPADSSTAGPLRIEGPGVGQVLVRATVTTPVDLSDPTKGVKGSEFQSFSALSPEAVGTASTPVAIYPGLQKYSGIRTNLILAEVSGQSARVRLRAINGATGGVLAELDRPLAAWERVQVNDIWNGDGGFGVGDAALDKVAISIEPVGADPGRVVSALSVIDNVTNSARILVLSPPGPPPQIGVGVGR